MQGTEVKMHVYIKLRLTKLDNRYNSLLITLEKMHWLGLV